MHRASNTFSVLQATAATVALALILWSIGVPSFRFAEAAALTDFSNTLSTSEPSTASDHTIEFVTPTGVGSLEDIVVTFEPGSFDLSTIGPEDVDLLDNGTNEGIPGAWTVATTSNTITITSLGGGVIGAGATTTILIGLHATNEGSPNSQIINPASTGPSEITVTAGASDTGETVVAIVDEVTVSASVDTQFTFQVLGVANGETVNTADTTGASTTPIEIAFGELDTLTASTAAQDLVVTTNAANGFVVTVTTNQQLTSEGGAVIDGFSNGSYATSAIPWTFPTAVFGSPETYGHWGITTEDPTIGPALDDQFNVLGGGDRFVSASTTPVEVFRHNGPANGTGSGEGTTRVGYKVEVSGLQEAGTDYTATLTYVATPVF